MTDRHLTRAAARPRLAVLGGAVGVLILLAATRAAAAPLVGADPAGACAGITPCFTTLQEAVDNAGPGPSEVRVFPGTYAESVVLETMGSAVGGGPDDLTLVAVDASGVPASGGAVVDPAAGPAISTGLGGPFAGDLVVDGLEVHSPGSSALVLASDGAVAVRRVLAQFATAEGVFVGLATTVEITDTVARLNGGNGIVVFASGAVTVEGSVAERNDNNGFALVGGTVTVTASLATANVGDGFVILPTDSCVIADSQSVGNTVGYSIGDLLGPPPAPLLAIGDAGRALDRARRRAVSVAADLRARAPVPSAGRRSAPAHTAGLHVEVSGSEAIDNLEDGLLAVGDVVEVELFTATGNGGTGVSLGGAEVSLSGSVLLANRTGALLAGGAVTLASSEASDSTPFDGSPIPLSGSGFFILAEQATITLARARRNESAGFLLAGGSTVPSTVALVDSLAEEGLFGVLIQALDGAAMTVAIDGLISRRNGGGVSFGGADAVTVRDSEIVENTVGINGVVEGLLAIESSDLRENAGGGVTLELEPGSQASIRCSNISANTAHGARLQTPGALDARNNFWGDASGPVHPANPGGTGDRAIDAAAGGAGTIDFSSFLAQEATAADCAVAVVEIPALGPAGGVLLALALALAGLGLLLARRRRPPPACP